MRRDFHAILQWRCNLRSHRHRNKTRKLYSTLRAIIMMTSSNGNIFRVTGLLCGEFTGYRWIPLTNVSDAELSCYFDQRLNKSSVNNRKAGDLRNHRTNYDVTVMYIGCILADDTPVIWFRIYCSHRPWSYTPFLAWRQWLCDNLSGAGIPRTWAPNSLVCLCRSRGRVVCSGELVLTRGTSIGLDTRNTRNITFLVSVEWNGSIHVQQKW